jgi:hypothetical protein
VESLGVQRALSGTPILLVVWAIPAPAVRPGFSAQAVLATMGGTVKKTQRPVTAL